MAEGRSDSAHKETGFLSELIGNKPVTAIPGIEQAHALKLRGKGVRKAYVILGVFLALNKDKDDFAEWLKKAAGANSTETRMCFNALKRCRAHRGASTRGSGHLSSRAHGNSLGRQFKGLHLAADYLSAASSSRTVRGNCSQRSSSVAPDRGAFEFSVASYNVLAQDLLEEHAYLYQHCDDRQLHWSYRRKNIMRQLNKNSPDIICLQEVQYDDFHDFFFPRLQHRGYQASYKKSGGRTDGCATFYKQSKFNCCNSVPVELCADDCSVLNRPNVALLLLLEPLVSGQTNCSSTCICVANTHLLYNPCRGDVKLAQLMFLFAAIDELAGMSAEPRPKYHPMILCGDFNLEPFSYLYEFVVNGSLRFEGLPMKALSGQTRDESGRRMNPRCFLSPQVDVTDSCQFFDVTEHRQRLSRCSHRWRSFDESFCSGTACHSLNLASAYDNMSPDALTSWLGHRSRGAQVDYIFYSVESPLPHSGRGRFRKCRSMSEALLTLTCVLQLPTLEEVCRSGGLPNNRESSDHLMLMAWFVLSNCV